MPLGGLGEFGMNSMAIRYGDDIIVIDAGMMFPEAELLGVDIVTPDFAYLERTREMVRGLVLTHGHEDHIGGIPFLLSQTRPADLWDGVYLRAGGAPPRRARSVAADEAPSSKARATRSPSGRSRSSSSM